MNTATVIVASVIAVIFIAIVVCGIRNIKAGKGSCSCGCKDCSMKDICHDKKKK